MRPWPMLWFVVINFYKTSNAFYKHREFLKATQHLQSSTLRSRIGGRNAHAVLSAISAFARSHSRFRRIELTSTIAIIINRFGRETRGHLRECAAVWTSAAFARTRRSSGSPQTLQATLSLTTYSCYAMWISSGLSGHLGGEVLSGQG